MPTEFKSQMNKPGHDLPVPHAPILPVKAKSVATLQNRPFKRLASPQMIVVLALLGGGALLRGPLERWLKVVTHKEAVPLRASLASLNREALGPYRVIHTDFLTPEYIEALGTDQYLIWTLEDTRQASDSPLRRVHLFITYYTGGPELVVHRPDECFRASGYAVTEFRRNEVREIDTLRRPDRRVPFRVVTFRKTGLFQQSELSVAYTLYCNGRFTVSPTEVRFWTTSPTTTSAYYSKVEVCFLPSREEAGTMRSATSEETLNAAVELLRFVLPILMDAIWPDIEAS